MTIEAPEIDESAYPQGDKAYGYSQLLEDAILARKAMDTGRWILGECVLELETRYREHTMDQFADEILIDPKRLYEYKLMAAFYPAKERQKLAHLPLSYTHFREAKRLGDLEQAMAFLEDIALNLWTIQDTRNRLKIMLGLGVNVSAGSESPVSHGSLTAEEVVAAGGWQGRATVKTARDGSISLKCETPPGVVEGEEYIVTFQKIIK